MAQRSYISLALDNENLRLTVIGLSLNIGLNLFFIPRHGIAGAAVATALARLAQAFLYQRHLNQNHGTRLIAGRDIMQISLAFTVMLAIILAVPAAIWIRLSVGFAAYVLSLALLKNHLLRDIYEIFRPSQPPSLDRPGH